MTMQRHAFAPLWPSARRAFPPGGRAAAWRLAAAGAALWLAAGCGGDRSAADPARRRTDALLRQLRQGQLEERKVAAEELGRLKCARAVDPLIRSLSEPQPPIRQAAAAALGALGDRRAVPALIRALGDAHAETRKLAMDALGKIGDERALEPILERLGDPELTVRCAVGPACARLGPKTAEPLIEALQASDANRRAAAAFALGHVRHARGEDALLRALSDSQVSVRLTAAEALGNPGNTAGCATDARVVGALARLLAEPLDAADRKRFDQRMAEPVTSARAREIAQALIRREGERYTRGSSAMERLVHGAQKKQHKPTAADEDLDRLRKIAADPLTPAKAVELTAIIEDRIGPQPFAALTPAQQETAVQREREHVRLLLSDPPSEMKSAELDGVIARRLGQRWWNGLSERQRQDAVRREFVRPVEDERRFAAAEVRRAAARALGNLHGETAVRRLVEAAGSPDKDLRTAAEDGLRLLTREDAPLLRTAALDRNLPVDSRVQAVAVLGRFAAERPPDGADTVAVDALLALLGDPLAAVRTAAAEGLAAANDPRATPALAAALGDPDTAVRLAVLQALGRTVGGQAGPRPGVGEVMGPLVLALRDTMAAVRVAAAQVLGASGQEGAVGPLLETLAREQRGDSDPHVLAACCRALGLLKARAAVDALLPLLRSDDNRESNVAAAAATALGRIGDPRAVPPLIALLEKRAYRSMFVTAQALGEIGDPRALDVLLAHVQHGDGLMSHLAIAAVGRIQDPRATTILMEILRDPHPDKRKKAAEALVSQGARAVSRLVEALADDGRDYRGLAAQTLGYIGEPAVDPLLRVLEKPARPESVPVAIYALSTIRDDRARAAILAKMRDPDAEIRANAAWALGSAGGDSADTALRAALGDPDERVRKSARSALDRLQLGVPDGAASGGEPAPRGEGEGPGEDRP
jgi:HEAT repeat protein